MATLSRHTPSQHNGAARVQNLQGCSLFFPRSIPSTAMGTLVMGPLPLSAAE